MGNYGINYSILVINEVSYAMLAKIFQFVVDIIMEVSLTLRVYRHKLIHTHSYALRPQKTNIWRPQVIKTVVNFSLTEQYCEIITDICLSSRVGEDTNFRLS